MLPSLHGEPTVFLRLQGISKNYGFNLIDGTKMGVSGNQRSTDFHAARSYPHVIEGYF